MEAKRKSRAEGGSSPQADEAGCIFLLVLPLFQNSIIPVFQNFVFPFFHFSNIPLFQPFVFHHSILPNFSLLSPISCLKSRAMRASQGAALRQWRHGTKEATRLIVSLSGPCCHVDFRRRPVLSVVVCGKHLRGLCASSDLRERV